MRGANAKGLAVLVGLALVVTALLSGVERATAARIAQNREQAAWLAVSAILQDETDLALAKARDWQNNRLALCDGRWLTRTPQPGYGGEFELLALLNNQGDIERLRVTRQLETPGIGDFIADPNDPWMQRVAAATDLNAIDAVSGATITSAAVIMAVSTTLQSEPPQECAP